MNLITLSKAIFSRKYPSYIIFFVTSKCNMKCMHCFYWQNLNNCKNELSATEIESIFKSIPELFFLRITGGEPFLREDIYQIIKIIYKNTSVRKISISTNGFFTTRIIEETNQIVNNLKDLSFEIGISIDNLNGRHDEIRNCPGAFKKAMDTYEQLAKIRKKTNNLRLGFIITMMKDNQHDLDGIFQYLKSNQPDTIGLNMIRGVPKDASRLDVDIEKYDRFRHFINEYNFRDYPDRTLLEKIRAKKTILSQDIIIKTIKSRKAQFKCLAGEKIAVLYPDGNVSACELLNSNIGNIRDYGCDFWRFWQKRASKRREINRYIYRTECFCTHECFITAALLFNPNNFLKFTTIN